MKLQIAITPCHPPYGLVVGEDELWDGDCAASTLSGVLERAEEKYPGEEVIMFNDPRHYSKKEAA